MANSIHFLIRLALIIALALFLAGATVKPLRAAPPIWPPPDLAKIIDEGLSQNKEIQSLKLQVTSLKEEIPFAGSLADPRVGIGLLNLPVDTFRFDQEPMTQKQLFIAQKIPWFGKLSLKTQIAVLKAYRQEAILMAKQLELARQIATAYYELGFIAGSRKINERLAGMVNRILRMTEIGYAAGRGLQQDVILAQVEFSKILDEKIMLGKKYRTLEDKINELLNRESFTPVNPPGKMIYPDVRLNVKNLQAQALKKNPWIRVRESDVKQADLKIELAMKDYWPDMDFKVAYGQRDEDFTDRDLDDFVSASVVINIPLRNGHQTEQQ
ncbi:MAG: TolC family protein [Deltaproteobacteria bacterium]|nr:TolC family protein [Deltaproteobacteria bacterium]